MNVGNSAGLMQMIDQGEQDDKIIGVHADDPEYRDYTDISELPPHRLKEIKRRVLSSCIALVSCRPTSSYVFEVNADSFKTTKRMRTRR